MLAIFLLAGIVGLALLAYFWPAATTDQNFPFTRAVFGAGILAYAINQLLEKVAVIGREKELLIGAAFSEAIGWLLVIIGMRGIFVLLCTRCAKAQRGSSNPE